MNTNSKKTTTNYKQALRHVHDKIIEKLQDLVNNDFDFSQLLKMLDSCQDNELIYSQLSTTLFDYYQIVINKNFVHVDEYSKLQTLTQKLEEQIRLHIRTQQHLKIYVEGLDDKILQLEKYKQNRFQLLNIMDEESRKNKQREEDLVNKIRSLESSLKYSKKKSAEEPIKQEQSKKIKISLEIKKSKSKQRRYSQSIPILREKLSLPSLHNPQILMATNIIRSKKPHDMNQFRQQSAILNTKQQILKNMNLLLPNNRRPSINLSRYDDNHIVVK